MAEARGAEAKMWRSMSVCVPEELVILNSERVRQTGGKIESESAVKDLRG